jgi:hypothetical protein
MIAGRTKPEIYALRLYQIEIEGFAQKAVSAMTLGQLADQRHLCSRINGPVPGERNVESDPSNFGAK